MSNNDYKDSEMDCNSSEPNIPRAKPVGDTVDAYNEFQTSYNTAGDGDNGGFTYNYSDYDSYLNSKRYINMGGAVVDCNGKELKNHFGIKLTLSILEMLCCCYSGCITLIMGILACVFTCQANTSFREGRYEDFKSNAKTSTILLIVGGVMAAIVLILNVVWTVTMDSDMFMDTYEEILEEELETDIDIDTLDWDIF